MRFIRSGDGSRAQPKTHDCHAAAGQYRPESGDIIIAHSPQADDEVQQVIQRLTEQARQNPSRPASYRQYGHTIRMRPIRIAIIAATATAAVAAAVTTSATSPAIAIVTAATAVATVISVRHIQLILRASRLADRMASDAEQYHQQGRDPGNIIVTQAS